MRTVSQHVLAAMIGVLAAGVSASAQSPTANYTPVTQDMLLNPPEGDWLMWRRTVQPLGS